MGELLIEVPIEKLKTGGAIIGSLSIRVLNTGGRRHDAMPIHAVGEAEGVTKFVHCSLFHSR